MPATPEDHKSKSEPFIWTAPNGKKVKFKPFNDIPTGVFRKLATDDEMKQMFAVIEYGTDAKGLAVIDEVPIGKLEELIAAWASASGAELPES